MSGDSRLPAFVQGVGGSLTEVLAWSEYASLTIAQKVNVSMIVDRNPSLNTVPCVDMLASVATAYKEKLGPWFNLVLEENGIQDVHMAIELLSELGVCSPGEMQQLGEGEHQIHPLELTVDLIDRLRQDGYTFEGTEALAIIVEDLGGWFKLCGQNPEVYLPTDAVGREKVQRRAKCNGGGEPDNGVDDTDFLEQ